ncbi:hypothetical protein [Nocardia higoensis]|uniref:hypothetical protein n=1 Tax=Nocardia higoensis TaxID=228599 RepID=UPI0012F64D70|nr:hypothetical protein [Nocardia higoensis]
MPLPREEALAVLVEGLTGYFASVRQLLGAGQAMARLLGDDHLVVFAQMLAEHERHDRVVHLTHHALLHRPHPRSGDDCEH